MSRPVDIAAVSRARRALDALVARYPRLQSSNEARARLAIALDGHDDGGDLGSDGDDPKAEDDDRRDGAG